MIVHCRNCKYAHPILARGDWMECLWTPKESWLASCHCDPIPMPASMSGECAFYEEDESMGEDSED